jgi:hypothetical protein
MNQVLSVAVCVLLLLAAMFSSSTASSSQPDPARPDLEATRTEDIAPTPEDAEPASPEEDDWASRYPREYEDWKDSVHGRARLSGDTGAPGCTGCHDDPESGTIRTSAFRLSIPSRCAECHDDAELMREHDVATDVYATYRADYHGLTIDYYRAHDASAWRYEAVCSDCHESHAVYRSSDERSSVAPANLLDTCRRCHSGAEPNFASATTGHFRTDRDSSLLAYYIELIYRILIPVIIGLMAAYVALDLVHRLRGKLAGTR